MGYAKEKAAISAKSKVPGSLRCIQWRVFNLGIGAEESRYDMARMEPRATPFTMPTVT